MFASSEGSTANALEDLGRRFEYLEKRIRGLERISDRDQRIHNATIGLLLHLTPSTVSDLGVIDCLEALKDALGQNRCAVKIPEAPRMVGYVTDDGEGTREFQRFQDKMVAEIATTMGLEPEDLKVPHLGERFPPIDPTREIRAGEAQGRKRPENPIYAQMKAISAKTGCKVERDPEDPHVLVVDKPHGPPERIAIFRTKEEAEAWAVENLEPRGGGASDPSV
jgi:hypothetical protein